MARKKDTWMESRISQDLKEFFESFTFEIPEDTTNLSFAMELLEGTPVDEFESDIKSLSKDVVFHRSIINEDIRPGTVFVCEVDAKLEGYQVVIKEETSMDNFFQLKKAGIVKVILVYSNCLNIIDTKYIVYEKYKKSFKSESIHIQHELEDYDELFRLCAHEKIYQQQEFVESLMKSIPIDNIPTIVQEAADKVLSKENITQLCFSSVIRECGNVERGPYKCFLQSTINRLKTELVKTTIQSVSLSLGNELCKDILLHIENEIKSSLSSIHFKFRIPPNPFRLVEENFISLVSSLLISVIGIARAIATTIVTLWQGVDINSRSWRIEIATEIHQMVLENKSKMLEELSSNITPRCRATAHHLKMISKQLEDTRRRINLTDQKKMIKDWENRDVIKDKNALKSHKSIICYMAGRQNGYPVVKVFLRYDDKEASAVFKANTNIQFVSIAKRCQELSKNIKEIKLRESRAPSIKQSDMFRFGYVINDQAGRLYANHSNVIGLGMSNVRSIAGTIREEPCIVIYCLDKSIIPFGENALPESLQNVPCDVREDIILFGSCNDCENVCPGCSIGISFKNEYGSAGFLAKSNLLSNIHVSGFLTAAHVAIPDLHELYSSKVLMSKSTVGRKKHTIVHPSWVHSGKNEPVGEVWESFCGNFNDIGIDAAFVRNDEPTKKGLVRLEETNENDLTYGNVNGTVVRKKGRRTGETEGILINSKASFSIHDVESSANYQFNNCYEIINKPGGCQPFFKRGDSGSGVYIIDKLGRKKAIGIAFALRVADGTTFACKINQITQALNITLYQDEEEDMDTS